MQRLSVRKFLVSVINTNIPNKGRKCSKETEHYLDKIYYRLSAK